MNERDIDSAKLRIAVMASGSGTTLQAIIDACEAGTLAGEIVLVISNNSRSGVVDRARRHRLSVVHLSSHTHPDAEALDHAIAECLCEHSPDVVLLAGYMKKLGPHVLEAFAGRIINTHPSLLPKFGGKGMYGSHVHAAVIAAGDERTGISVHLVDRDYDTGRVLAQREVEVGAADTPGSLAQRVQSVERPFLIEVLQQIASGSIRLDPARRTRALES
jgi:phosphoribosylglycinamide formyltransferase-1